MLLRTRAVERMAYRIILGEELGDKLSLLEWDKDEGFEKEQDSEALMRIKEALVKLNGVEQEIVNCALNSLRTGYSSRIRRTEALAYAGDDQNSMELMQEMSDIYRDLSDVVDANEGCFSRTIRKPTGCEYLRMPELEERIHNIGEKIGGYAEKDEQSSEIHRLLELDMKKARFVYSSLKDRLLSD